MANADLKTKKTTASVSKFIDDIADEKRRADCRRVLEIISPRKDSLTLCFMTGIERYKAILARLGKHKTGKGCLYIKSLEDVDADVLRELITTSKRDLKKSGT